MSYWTYDNVRIILNDKGENFSYSHIINTFTDLGIKISEDQNKYYCTNYFDDKLENFPELREEKDAYNYFKKFTTVICSKNNIENEK